MRRIIIESGHHFKPGKPDPGAVSDGYKEAELTRHAKNRVAYHLRTLHPDVEVLLDDDEKTLSEVLKWIREVEGNSSLIYSLHWNAASSNSATGVEAFISDKASKKSKEMAPRMVDIVHHISGLRSRGVKTESQSNRGRLGILNTNSPAVLIEFAFINNPQDREDFFEWEEQIYITMANEMAYQARTS